MHILVINFQLVDLTPDEFYGLCDELAPAWAEVPGLISKIWLADNDANTYGGVYTFESREATGEYLNSELANAVATHPNFTNITARDFAVIEAPTRVTRGLAAVPA